MNTKLTPVLAFLLLSTSAVPAQERVREPKADAEARRDVAFTKLIAVLNPVGDREVRGTVVFERTGAGVRITAEVRGLTPNTKHGFHVHEFGDLGSPDAKSAGGHFNPGKHPHALPDTELRHAGDLGNLESGDDGTARLALTVHNISLGAGDHGILGRCVIVHAKMDDGSQPTGNAGDRIAAGVIGISKDGVGAADQAGHDREGT